MKKLILLANLFVSIFANAQTRDTTYTFDATTYPNQIGILKVTAPIYICDNKNNITVHFKAGDFGILTVKTYKNTIGTGLTYLVKNASIIKYSNDTTFIFSLDSFLVETKYYLGNPNPRKIITFIVNLKDNTKTFVNAYIIAEICTPWTTGIESVSDKRLLTTNYINYLGQPTNECRPCIEELIFDDGSRQRKQVSY